MKFILSDNEQVEGYAKLLNLTTRSDMADNKYFQAEPLVQDVAKALEVGRTPYTLTFFEQINSPQGPWLQMLQRAYYTDDDLDTVIADAQGRDEGDLLPVVGRALLLRTGPRRFARAVAAPTSPAGRSRRPSGSRSTLTMLAIRRQPPAGPTWRAMLATRRNKLTGLLFLAPALLFVLAFTVYPLVQMVWMSFNNWSLITPPEVHRDRQLHARVQRQPVLGVAELQPRSTRCSSRRS